MAHRAENMRPIDKGGGYMPPRNMAPLGMPAQA